jgi:hypothetical protein
MAERILSLRELNRATLARQMLLERHDLSVPAAVERLVGMQAQLAQAPYIGLWTRLHNFEREDLARLIEDHTIIKATLMRATLHLFTAADYVRLRGAIQPALDGAFEAVIKDRGKGLDYETIIAEAREFLAEAPRSFAEITAKFAELMPDADPGAVRYGIRTRLPLIQVPISTGWSYPGNPKFTLAETWLGRAIPTEADPQALVRRYLAAFGPASVKDMQIWSGVPGLQEVVDQLRPELVIYRDERKRELFDLPDMPLPDGDTPAPERFLPEFDNLLLSHDKRTRVLADEYRKKVYLPGLRVSATILVDGFVQGGWKIEKARGIATLLIEPFAPLTKQNQEALATEAERLVRFVEGDAKGYAVKFAD